MAAECLNEWKQEIIRHQYRPIMYRRSKLIVNHRESIREVWRFVNFHFETSRPFRPALNGGEFALLYF